MTKNQKLFKKAFFVILAGIIMISAPPVYSEGDALHAHADENAVIVTAPVLLDRSALVPIEPLQNPSRAALYSVDDCEHNDTYFIDYHYMHPHYAIYGCNDCSYVFWDYSTTYPGNYEGCEENTAILNVYWSTTGSNYTHLKTYTSTEIATFCNTYSTTVSEYGTPAGYTFSGTSYITDAQGTGRTAGSSATVYFNESSLYGHVRFTYVASSCTHPNLSNATPNLEHTSLGHRVNYTCLDCNASVLSFVPLTGCGLCYPGQCQHLSVTILDDGTYHHEGYDGHLLLTECNYCGMYTFDVSRKPCSECWDCHEPVDTYGPHVIGQGHTYSSICEYCDGDYISPYPQHNIAGCDDCENNATYLIQNKATGDYLTVYMGYDNNNQNVFIADREPATVSGTTKARDAQEFRLVHLGDGIFNINPFCSGAGHKRSLDVVRNSAPLASGQNVQIYKPSADPTATQFNIVYNESAGAYNIVMAGDYTLGLTANARTEATSSPMTTTGTTSTSSGNVYIDTISAANEYQQWIFFSCNSVDLGHYADITMLYPLGANSPYVTITSDYGWRNYGGDKHHNGMDITSSGTNPNLYAPFEAKVVHINPENSSSTGKYIVLEPISLSVATPTGTPLRIFYFHMDTISSDTMIAYNNCDNGATVNSQTILGTVGNTDGVENTNMGKHLHWAVVTNGTAACSPYNTIDPLLFNIVDPQTYENINFNFY